MRAVHHDATRSVKELSLSSVADFSVLEQDRTSSNAVDRLEFLSCFREGGRWCLERSCGVGVFSRILVNPMIACILEEGPADLVTAVRML